MLEIKFKQLLKLISHIESLTFSQYVGTYLYLYILDCLCYRQLLV